MRLTKLPALMTAGIAVTAFLLLGQPAPVPETLAPASGAAVEPGAGPVEGRFDAQRVEQEDRYGIPVEKVPGLWTWLVANLGESGAILHEVDPLLSGRASREKFTDVYFDTPELAMLAQENGVRHRTRINLDDPNDKKSGRQLVQVKVSGGEAGLERGEFKYAVEPRAIPEKPEDQHPLLGLVKPSQRDGLRERLKTLGVEADRTAPVLTVDDVRQRIYITRAGKDFMSVSLDLATGRRGLASAQFAELEFEINEVAYTEADEASRALMREQAARLVDAVKGQVPGLERNLTPKYNRSFDLLARKLPLFRVWAGRSSDDLMLGAFIALGVPAVLVTWWVRRRRARQDGGGTPGVRSMDGIRTAK